MAMLCPKCKQQYNHSLQCPQCRVNLIRIQSDGPNPRQLLQHWARNTWFRIFIGVLAAQGIWYGMQQFLLAGLIATEKDASNLWIVLLSQGVQLCAVLFGSALAGAGMDRGLMIGIIVGIWTGILTILIQSLNDVEITSVSFYSLPLLHMAIGAFGGTVASTIWRPISALSFDDDEEDIKLPFRRLKKKSKTSDVPLKIHWMRIIIGVSVIVAGIIWAETILEIVKFYGRGKISIRTVLKEWVLTIEISALAVLIGASFAGATTWHGSVQGLIVGLISATMLAGFWFNRHGWNQIQTICFMIIGIILLSFFCGMFGGHLFPPVRPKQQTGQGYRTAEI